MVQQWMQGHDTLKAVEGASCKQASGSVAEGKQRVPEDNLQSDVVAESEVQVEEDGTSHDCRVP